jgi:hypothetical protein
VNLNTLIKMCSNKFTSGNLILINRLNESNDIQDDQKVSVHLMITVPKKRKNILNSSNH